MGSKFLLFPRRFRSVFHPRPTRLNEKRWLHSSVLQKSESSVETPKSLATTLNHPIPQLINSIKRVPTSPEPPKTPLQISESIKELLPLLTAQPSHYVTIHIHGKPYLVTAGDTVRLPFKMPGVIPGDILRLNKAVNIGSRDYTLKGTPYVDERLFECRATVMGTESEPMRIKLKTKRRNRKVKTVKSKHRYTILRIAELRIKNLEEF
ncbi:BgTH12-00901 [Blumeria graminis f. sp. triticale]|uniref:Large ribosomal subunit protein bL21m n=4 Tax=Blumeria graminis TaxID=34373 RepID=A0A656KNN8_BLUGR|nr:Mitochondrial ribosomal protein [Blumeria graminis f. sp. tritici 96224]CAD6505410.1 BgTH12-00901 [Blumeria graminis f. sp. triticale]VDB93504.1 Bgt-3420 [Blumeria graminis f. sp. tritici]